jgi:hypothetical protein
MGDTYSRYELFNKLRVHAKAMYARLQGMPDFDPDSPETFRHWRNYMIAYAVACNARSAHPLSTAEADEMGEQCGLWFWNNYHPKAFYEEQAKQQGVRYGRPIHEVIESLKRDDFFDG